MTQQPNDPRLPTSTPVQHDEALNPYTPSLEVADARVEFAAVRHPVHTWTVCWATMVSIGAAGAVFGLGLGLVGMFSAMRMPGRAEYLWIVPALSGVGGVYALAVSIPVVSLLALAFAVFGLSAHWSRVQVTCFAMTGGFLSGALSVSVPAEFDPEAALFSLVPGFIGAIVSGILIQSLARRCSLDPASTPAANEFHP